LQRARWTRTRSLSRSRPPCSWATRRCSRPRASPRAGCATSALALRRRFRQLRCVQLQRAPPAPFASPPRPAHTRSSHARLPPQGTYVDKKCPFTGNVSIRGRILKGVVMSTKMTRTVVIRRDYLRYITKYRRYEKRHKTLPAHCSPAFLVKEGDVVTVGQCRCVSAPSSYTDGVASPDPPFFLPPPPGRCPRPSASTCSRWSTQRRRVLCAPRRRSVSFEDAGAGASVRGVAAAGPRW